MVVKTYRGLLADGGQDRIRLQTIKGKVGYKIVKFDIMPHEPGNATQESVVQIWKKEVATVSTQNLVVDFTDSDLLATSYYVQRSIVENGQNTLIVIFDNEVFNQDIYVTHTDQDSAVACNYYIELEVIPLDDAGAEYTTLKDMRST